jgi:3-oxoacyl-[acyl-carrier-protein] synthase II
MTQRVVVTGLGMVTSLGYNVQENWLKLLDKHVAIKQLTSPEYKSMPSRVAGQIDSEQFQKYILTNNLIKKSELKSISTANTYALVAANEAINDSGWLPQSEQESIRSGTSIATGISGISEIADAALSLAKSNRGYKAISPYFVPKILPNLSCGLISIKYKLKV